MIFKKYLLTVQIVIKYMFDREYYLFLFRNISQNTIWT